MAGLFRNKGAKEYADSVNDLAMQLDNLIAEATANAAKGVDIKSKKRDSERVSPEIAAERKEIEETAKANGTWLKAPNGKDTNLAPEQWVTVRTKAFKNWFGDWELIAKFYPSKKIYSVDEAMESIAILFDKPLTNDAFGFTATISKNKSKKLHSGKAIKQSVNSRLHALAIANIQQLFENAEIDYTHPDTNGTKEIERVHRLGTLMFDAETNALVPVKITAFEYNTGTGNKIYSIEAIDVEEIKKPAGQLEDDSIKSPRSPIADFDTKIETLYDSAKGILENSSKIVDENGEPKVVYHGGQFGISNFTPNRNMHFGTKKAAMQRILDEQWGYDNWLVQNEDGSYSWKYEDEYDEAYNAQSNKTFATEEEAMEDALLYFGNEVVVKPYFLNIRNIERTNDAQSSWDDAIEVVKAESDNVDGIVYENWYEDKGSDSYIAFEPNQIKSATENVGTYDANNPDIRFSLRTNGTPIFYSNAQKAVLDIKQEKATPEQWLKMIEKAGGLKAGEDKWLGLSDWLKTSDKKTLTKDEVLQYIAENDIQIEEVSYADVADISIEEIYESAEFAELRESLTEYDEDDNPYINRERYDELRSESYDFVDGFSLDYWGEELEINSPAAAATYLGLTKADKEINETRLGYTTQGLSNKREIALVVPTIEPWNTSDNIHFGDAGEGRAVAWIRFGETEAPKNVPMHQRVEEFDEPFETATGLNFYAPKNGNGKFAKDYVLFGKLKDGSEAYIAYIGTKPISKHKTLEEARNAMNEYYEANPRMVTRYERVLVIDEIQSKRHQDARDKGYIDANIEREIKAAEERLRQANKDLEAYKTPLKEKYGFNDMQGSFFERLHKFHAALSTEENAEMQRLAEVRNTAESAWNEIASKRNGIPSAPFEKNWAELAFKRMLRYAAENGYDYVAWTTGDQQAERYNIGAVLQGLKAYKTSADTYYVIPYNNGAIGEFVKEYTEQELAETFGKELAAKIIANTENATEENPYEIEGEGLRIGGEGMRGFYDQMLPSFVKKYTKKWGAEVKDITMPELEENNTMHAVNVTDSMRDSVMQGQPKFSLRDVEAQRFNRKVEFVKGLVRDFNIPNPLFIAETKEEFVRLVKDYDGDVDEFTSETYGYYCPSDDIILLNGGMFITSGNAHRSTMHEYAHSITRKYLGAKLAEVTASILETEIDKARKEILPEAYNDYSYPEIIDEFTSLLLEDLTIAETRAIFDGEMAIDTFVEKLKKDINAIEKISNKDVLYAVIPLVVENLKIQKEQYGKDREHTIVIPRVDSRRNPTFSKTSHLSGDKKSRSIEAESRIYETGRGGEGSQEEVTPRLSIRTDTAIAEEEYKQNLLESAQQMEREGHDAQAIADSTGWVHLADGNWKYYGEGSHGITVCVAM